jgi:hypothetical protein
VVEPEREAVVTVRMSKVERSMVEALAEADGVSISDAVRMAVRRAHANRFGETKRSKK